MAAIARSVSPEESRESSRNSNKIRPDFPLMQDKSGQQKQVANELQNWDLDGDGQITEAELIAAGRQQLQLKQSVRNLKKTVAVVSAVSVAVIAAFLAVVIVGNEVTKESRATSGSLVDTQGRSVATVSKTVPATVATLGVASNSELEAMNTLTLENGTSSLFFRIAGFDRDIDNGLVVFYTERGYTIAVDSILDSVVVFDDNGVELPLDVDDGEIASGSSGRRLSQFNNGFRGFGGQSNGRFNSRPGNRFRGGPPSFCGNELAYKADGTTVCCQNNQKAFISKQYEGTIVDAIPLYGCYPLRSGTVTAILGRNRQAIRQHFVNVLSQYDVSTTAANVIATAFLQSTLSVTNGANRVLITGSRDKYQPTVADRLLRILFTLDIDTANAAATASGAGGLTTVDSNTKSAFIDYVKASTDSNWLAFKTLSNTADVLPVVMSLERSVSNDIRPSIGGGFGPPQGGQNSGFQFGGRGGGQQGSGFGGQQGGQQGGFGGPRRSQELFPMRFRGDIRSHRLIGYGITRSGTVEGIITMTSKEERQEPTFGGQQGGGSFGGSFGGFGGNNGFGGNGNSGNNGFGGFGGQNGNRGNNNGFGGTGNRGPFGRPF